MTVSTTETEYTLQTSQNGTTWKNGEEIASTQTNSSGRTKSSQTFKANGTLYARLKDDKNGKTGKIYTKDINKIDATGPEVSNVQVTQVTTDSITITASMSDTQSRVGKCYYSKDNGTSWEPMEGITTDEPASQTNGCSKIAKYQFSKDNGATWEPENGVVAQEGKKANYEFKDITRGTKYTFKMKAIDQAGNERESQEVAYDTPKFNLSYYYDEDSFNDEDWWNRDEFVNGETVRISDEDVEVAQKVGWHFAGWSFTKNANKRDEILYNGTFQPERNIDVFPVWDYLSIIEDGKWVYSNECRTKVLVNDYNQRS